MAEATKTATPARSYSIRHEVGVMAGFIALFIIASVAYGAASRIANARSLRREVDRREQLTQKGFGATGYASAEKSG
ncbi:hypothetical protein MMC31_001398 [Peltigera leucophlebia]|nr:hypothetical protein [Peltigera leucophlebia]